MRPSPRLAYARSRRQRPPRHRPFRRAGGLPKPWRLRAPPLAFGHAPPDLEPPRAVSQDAQAQSRQPDLRHPSRHPAARPGLRAQADPVAPALAALVDRASLAGFARLAAPPRSPRAQIVGG